jgi:hypothetical protein
MRWNNYASQPSPRAFNLWPREKGDGYLGSLSLVEGPTLPFSPHLARENNSGVL